MAFPEVGIRGVADMADFKSGMDQYNATLDETIGSTQKAAEKLTAVGMTLTKNVTAPILGIAGAAVKLAVDAAKIDNVRQSFMLMAEAVGVDAVQSLENMRSATKNLITDADLMRTANKALAGSTGAVQKAFLDNLPAIQQFALRMSQVQGIPLDVTLDKFVTGLKRMSPMMIDDTGLMLKLSEVTEKAGEMFSKTAMATVDNSEAMAGARVKIQDLEGQISLVGIKMGEWTDKTKESTKAAAKMRLDKLNKQLKEQKDKLTVLATAHGVVAEAVEGATTEFSKEEQMLALLALIGDKMGPQMEVLGDIQMGLAERVAVAQTQIKNLVDKIGLALIPIVEMALVPITRLVEQFVAFGEKAAGMISSLMESNPRLVEMGLAFAAAAAAVGPVLLIVGKIVAVLGALNPLVLLAAAAVGVFALAWKEDFAGIRGIIEGVVSTLQAFGNFIRDVVVEGDTLNDWLTHIPEPLRGVAQAFGEIVLKAKEFAEGLVDSIIAIRDVFQAEGIAGVIEVAGKKISDAIEAVFGERVAEIIDTFVGDVTRGLSDIQDAFSAGGIQDAIQEFGEQVYNVIDKVFGERVAEIVATFMEDVQRGLSDIQDAFEARGVRGAIEEFGEQVYGVIEKVFGAGVADLVADFVEDVERGLSDIKDAFDEGGIVRAVEELGRQIFGVIEDVFGEDIADAVAEFVENTREFLEDVKDAFEESGIVGAIEEVGSQIYESIEEAFGTEAADLIAEFADNTREFIENIVAGFQEGGAPGAIEAFGVEVYKALEDAFGTEVAGLVADFAQGVKEDLDELKTAFDTGGVPALVEEFSKKFKEGLDIILDTEVAQSITAFVEGVGETLGELKDAFDVGGVPELVGDFAKKFTEGINIIFDKDISDKQVGGFVKSVTEDIAELAEAFAVDGLPGVVDDFGKKFEVGFDIIFGEGMLTKISEFISGIGADLVDLATAFREEGVTGALTEFGTKFDEGFQIIIDNTLGKFFNFVGDIAGKIQEGIIEFGDRIGAAASGFIDAFVQGLIDAITTLPERAGELFQTLGAALINTLKSALLGSPEYASYYIALDFMRDFVKGLDVGDVDIANAIAGVISNISQAIEDAVQAFGVVSGFAGGAVLRTSIDALVADVRYVLVQVREKLLDLWGWGGQREDTVWGHMISWAESVSSIISVVAEAVEAFKGLEGYTGVMPGVIEMLVADIQLVLAEMGKISVDTVDAARVEWAEFAASLIAAIAGMIDDMQVLAAFEGDLNVSQNDIEQLIITLAATATNIVDAVNFLDSFMKEWGGAGLTIDEFVKNWIDFSTGLVSAVAGMIEDIEALATFEGGLNVSQNNVKQLIITLAVTATNIVEAVNFLDTAIKELGGAGLVIDEFVANWLAFSTGLVSTLAGVIEDFKTIGAFKNDIEIGYDKIQNMTWALGQTAKNILDAIDVPSSDFQKTGSIDALKTAWLEFSAGLVATLAGIVEDFEIIGAFKNNIEIGYAKIQSMTWELSQTATNILNAIDIPTSDFQETDSIDALKAAWLEFSAGLLATLAGITEDFEIIGAFKNDIEIGYDKIQNMTWALGQTASNILDAIDTPTSDFQDTGSIDALKAAWLEFSAGLVATLAGIVGDFETIGAFKNNIEIGYDKIQSMTWELGQAARNIITAIEIPTSDFQKTDSIDALKAAWLEFSAGLVSTIAGVIDDLGAIAAMEGPLTVNAANVESIVVALGDAVEVIIEEIGDLAEFDEDAMAAAQTFADTAGAVVSVIADGVEGFTALADFVQPSQQAMRDFADAVGDLVVEFERVAEDFTSDGLAAAAEFADVASAVVDVIADGVEAFLALKKFEKVPDKQLKSFAKQIGKAIKVMEVLAEEFEKEMLNDVKNFAETADVIFEFLEQAVSVFEDLGDLEDISYQGILALERGIKQTIGILADLAETLTTDMLPPAIDFAGAATSVMDFVSDAIDFLHMVSGYETLDVVWSALRTDIAAIIVLVGQIADDTTLMLSSAVAFADNAASVMDFVIVAVDLLSSVSDYDLDIPWSALRADIGAIIILVAEIAGDTEDMLASAVAFAADASGVIDFVSDAVGFLNIASGYTVSDISWSALRADIGAIIILVGQIALDTTTMLAPAAAFAATASDVIDFVSDAVGFLNLVSGYSGVDIPWSDLWDDIEDLIAFLNAIINAMDRAESSAKDLPGFAWGVYSDVASAISNLNLVPSAAGVADKFAAINAQISGGVQGYGVQQYISLIRSATEGAVSDANAFDIAARNIYYSMNSGIQWLLDAAQVPQGANLADTYLGLQGDVDLLLEMAGYMPEGSMALGALGYDQVCEFAEGIKEAASDCVAPAFSVLVEAVMSGVADVNAELDNLGVSGPRFQSLHELNAELMQTAAIAATALRTISLASEPRGMVPLGVGGGTTYNQIFNVSPTVTGNMFTIREEADIGRVSEAVLEAMREGLGDLTSRRERY